MPRLRVQPSVNWLWPLLPVAVLCVLNGTTGHAYAADAPPSGAAATVRHDTGCVLKINYGPRTMSGAGKTVEAHAGAVCGPNSAAAIKISVRLGHRATGQATWWFPGSINVGYPNKQALGLATAEARPTAPCDAPGTWFVEVTGLALTPEGFVPVENGPLVASADLMCRRPDEHARSTAAIIPTVTPFHKRKPITPSDTSHGTTSQVHTRVVANGVRETLMVTTSGQRIYTVPDAAHPGQYQNWNGHRRVSYVLQAGRLSAVVIHAAATPAPVAAPAVVAPVAVPVVAAPVAAAPVPTVPAASAAKRFQPTHVAPARVHVPTRNVAVHAATRPTSRRSTSVTPRRVATSRAHVTSHMVASVAVAPVTPLILDNTAKLRMLTQQDMKAQPAVPAAPQTKTVPPAKKKGKGHKPNYRYNDFCACGAPVGVGGVVRGGPPMRAPDDLSEMPGFAELFIP